MSKEFTEEDYIQSYKYQYRVDGDKSRLPEGFKPFVKLAELNGRLLWRQYEPMEPEEWNKLDKGIREAAAIQQIELLEELALLRPLSLVLANRRNSH